MLTARLEDSRAIETARPVTTTRVMLLAVAAACFIAVAALLSWPLEVPFLRGAPDARYGMVPNTAFALLLACGALLLNRKPLDTTSRIIAGLAALGTSILGGAELGSYLYGWDTGAIDLLRQTRGLTGSDQPVTGPRMAVNTAACLTALGVAILLLLSARPSDRPLRPWLRVPITILTTVVFATAFIALIGHLYSVTGLYAIRGLHAMSANTALGLCAVAIAVLFARPDEGLGQLITGSDAGALLTRRLLPVALLAPVFIGAAHVGLERSAMLESSAATILRSLVEVLLFLLVVLVTARKLRAIDQERARVLEAERGARAEAELERTRIERLQEFTASLGMAQTPQEVARATLETGCRAIGCESGTVYVVEDGTRPADTLTLVHALGYDDDTRRRWEHVKNNGDTLAGDAVARRLPVVVGRRALVAERYPAMLPMLDTTSYSGSAVFPLMPHGPALRGRPSKPGSVSDNSVLGAVAFDFAEERDLSQADLRFLSAVAGLCAQAIERTRLFQAEHAARKTAQAEREQLARLIDALPVMVTVYDPEFANTPGGGFTLNRAFVETLGWTEEDARSRGGDLMALCYPDPDVRAKAVEHMRHSSTSWLEIPTRAKNGRLIPLHWGSVQLGTRQVGVGVDQTAERERTAERAFLFEAERRSRAQAEAARVAAEEANRSKSQFLAKMSHELRTPLNAIGGHLQLVEMGLHGPVTDAQREALERAQKAQHHLLSLINDVLNYAKLEAGRVEFDLRPTSVADVVHEVASIMAPQVQVKGLLLDVSLPPSEHEQPTLVLADRDKLVQTLFNLISNAIKFTPATQPNGAPGRISVELTCPEGMLDVAYLSVHDTGIGIPEQRQSAIFDPFVQVNTGLTREHSGTGLGLAISRDLARGMGGDLWCQSVEDRGSTFTLMLKRAVDPQGSHAHPHADLQPAESAH
jgi:signal transduction histidine kinase